MEKALFGLIIAIALAGTLIIGLIDLEEITGYYLLTDGDGGTYEPTPTQTPSEASCHDDYCLSKSDCETQNKGFCNCDNAVECKYNTLSDCDCYYFYKCDNTKCADPDCYTTEFKCEYGNKEECGNSTTKTECEYSQGCYKFTGCVLEEGTTETECSDGTAYSSCSITKPKYCDNGILVNKCTECGCDANQLCNETNKTCALKETANTQENTTAENTETCIDSDRGRNYFEKGTATGLENGQVVTSTDACRHDGITLAEVLCEEKNLAVEQQHCPGGCSEGKCNETTTFKTCTTEKIGTACLEQISSNIAGGGTPMLDCEFNENTGELDFEIFLVENCDFSLNSKISKFRLENRNEVHALIKTIESANTKHCGYKFSGTLKDLNQGEYKLIITAKQGQKTHFAAYQNFEMPEQETSAQNKLNTILVNENEFFRRSDDCELRTMLVEFKEEEKTKISITTSVFCFKDTETVSLEIHKMRGESIGETFGPYCEKLESPQYCTGKITLDTTDWPSRPYRFMPWAEVLFKNWQTWEGADYLSYYKTESQENTQIQTTTTQKIMQSNPTETNKCSLEIETEKMPFTRFEFTNCQWLKGFLDDYCMQFTKKECDNANIHDELAGNECEWKKTSLLSGECRLKENIDWQTAGHCSFESENPEPLTAGFVEPNQGISFTAKISCPEKSMITISRKNSNIVCADSKKCTLSGTFYAKQTNENTESNKFTEKITARIVPKNMETQEIIKEIEYIVLNKQQYAKELSNRVLAIAGFGRS